MHGNSLLKWLEKNNLEIVSKSHYKYFKNVLIKAFRFRKDKEVLILGDWGFHGKRVAPIVCGSYYLAAQKLGYKTKIIMQKPKTRLQEAEVPIVEALYTQKPGSMIIWSLSNRPGSLSPVIGKSFRRYALEKKFNFISTTGLGGLETKDVYIITRALDIDYKDLKKVASKIAKIMDKGREIKIKTDAGTNLVASIQGMKSISIDGDYTGEVKGGNMPVGEVYIPPVTGSANGDIVIDGSSRHQKGTIIIEKPIKLKVRRSQIIKIEGGQEARILCETLRWARERAKRPSNVMKIGEIGIGINPKIDIVGSMVLDEKACNTAHVAIGSNYWFGGDIHTFLHLDQVMRYPKIYIDGKKLEY
ncbi:MAG: aminopeptidase [Candidatus Woesearchaeota archaeon]